ncbi:MAG: hypothetical protein KDC95_19730 [Planctomycetes bacterium]|nr:hypothetical protein [Planctomycetota bacterium]
MNLPKPIRRLRLRLCPDRAVALAGLFLAVLFCSAAGLRAQSSYSLIADINPGRAIKDSNPSRVTRVGAYIVFRAETPDYGDEWWSVPVSGGEPFLLRDIQPGTQGSRVYGESVVLHDVLYFVTEDSKYGRELWRTDGTPQGTDIALDLYTGAIGSGPEELVVAGGRLWFRALQRLYVTGGTLGTTRQVLDAGPFGNVSEIRELNANEVVFRREQGAQYDLWKSDGTTAGSGPILDPATNTPYRYVSGLPVNPSGVVVFESGFGATHGVYATDGTSAGTHRIIPAAGLVQKSAALAGNRVVFRCTISNQDQMYGTDGTVAGTFGVYGTRGTGAPVASGGLAWFVWTDSFSQFDLIVSDGTSSGTKQVASWSTPYKVDSWIAAPWEGGLFFSLATGSTTNDRYRITKDFTLTKLPESTEYPGARPVLATQDQVYWVAKSPTVGIELFELDAARTGLRLKANAATERGVSSSPNDFHFGNRIWFTADAGTGRELWVSDGTEATTKLVADLNPNGGTSISPVGELFGRFVFSARVRIDNELMVTDGTPQGTQRIASGNGSAGVRFVNKLWFPMVTPLEGYELACTDGTTAGTKVFDLVPGTGQSAPVDLKVWGNNLWFLAFDTGGTRQLFRCDGTSVHQVTDTTIVANIVSYDIHDGQILFLASSSASAGTPDLWGSDGTKQGTKMLVDLPSRSGGSTGYQVLSTRGLCFFCYYSTSDVWTLGATDGTAAGTRMITHPSAAPIDLIGAIEDRVFMLGETVSSSRSLLVSDGTVDNTRVLGLVVRWAAMPSGVGSRHTWVSFESAQEGYELWRTSWRQFDRVFIDVNPGVLHAYPTAFGIHHGRLFFKATRPDVGEELFAVDVATTGATSIELGEGCGDGVRPTLHATDAVLGDTLAFRGEWARADALGATFVGPELQPSIGIAGGCRVVCDLAHGVFLRAFVTDSEGSWKHDEGIPDDVSLLGLEVVFQAFFPRYVGNTPEITMSSAIRSVLGR